MALDYEDILAKCILESRSGRMDQAASRAAMIIDATEETVPAALRLNALTRLIWIEFHRGRHQAAIDIAASAIQLSRSIPDPAGEATARAYLARVLCEGDNIIKAADEAVNAARIARATGEFRVQSISYTILSIICSPLGIYDAGLQMAAEAIECAERSGDTEALCHALINDGSIHGDYLYRRGSGTEDEKRAFLSHAIKQTDRAWHLARQHDDGEMHRLAGFNLVEFLLMEDELEQAQSVMTQTEAGFENASARGAIHHAHAVSLMHMAHGNTAQAIASLRTAIEFYIQYPFLELAVFASEYLAKALAGSGDFEAAYNEQLRFQKLSQQLVNMSGNGFLRTALIQDEINTLKIAMSAERERAQNLEKSRADLQIEADRLLMTSLEDPLTGIGNRRRMAMVISDLDGKEIPYALALFDLDHFKAVNDRYSHLVGDIVIKVVGSLLQQILTIWYGRKAVAIRLGGEEYVAILETADKENARILCDTFRAALENYGWDKIAESLSVTVSAGLAMSSEADEHRSCMAIADARLYGAKRFGRNQVIIADAP